MLESLVVMLALPPTHRGEKKRAAPSVESLRATGDLALACFIVEWMARSPLGSIEPPVLYEKLAGEADAAE